MDGGHDAEGLANRQRHRVLDILGDASESMSIADLARELARRKSAIDEADDWKRARQYQIELYHHHVPKLANAGYVTVDWERRTVALSSNAPDKGLNELATLPH